MSTYPLANTAYHEAGHAVVAARLGYPVSRVTIEPTEDTLGSALHAAPLYGYDPEVEIEADEKIRQTVIIALAGSVAEQLYDPDTYEADWSGEDFEMVFDLTLRLGPDPAIGDALDRETRALVKTHWSEIERVAAALLEAGTLESAEFEKLLG